MRAHLLTIAGYIVSTLLVQGTSHLWINKAHYAALPFNRAEPVFVLGIASMIVQGAVLSFVYSRSRTANGSLVAALAMAWLFGAFLASYIALALPGEYQVPSVPAWFLVEAPVAAIQFNLIGACLWLAHHRFGGTKSA
jgi:hypothetical protein